MDQTILEAVLRMKLCAATAGHILRKLSLDCSTDHGPGGHEDRLCSKDQPAICVLRKAVQSPGYHSPINESIEADADWTTGLTST